MPAGWRRFRLALVFLLVVGAVACTGSRPSTTSASETGRSPSNGPSGVTVSAPPSLAPPPTGSEPYLLGVELEAEDPMPGGQVAWIANPTNRPLDLGCWRLRSVATGVSLTVARPATAPPHGAILLRPEQSWLRPSDAVELLDPSGREVDRTPPLRDASVDDRIWYRAGGRWRFGRTVFPMEVIDSDLLANATGC